MPYYVFKIFSGPTDLVKNLELDEEFESFKDAKGHARELRTQTGAAEAYTVKVMFADNRLQAEERLLEHRDAPILREWEK
ncbi:MAG: hypothetical protein JSW10_03295 [Pseudomonadota bacterium]|nr:MAG: hypothetical protein JSW10_03295 [Pseudomonadota bacterium]